MLICYSIIHLALLATQHQQRSCALDVFVTRGCYQKMSCPRDLSVSNNENESQN